MKVNPKKEEMVKVLREIFKNSSALVFLDFTGLSAEGFVKLRRSLRDKGGRIKVAKRRIFKIALGGDGLIRVREEEINSLLSGSTALLYTFEDFLPSLRILRDFIKEEKLKVKGALIEGRVFGEDVLLLADIPSREYLISKFASSLMYPFQTLLFALSYTLSKLLFALEEIKRKKEREGRKEEEKEKEGGGKEVN